MIFPDLYQEFGITYRYKVADILWEYKNQAQQYFKAKTMTESDFQNRTIIFLLFENQTLRDEYDLHYFNYFQIEDNTITYPPEKYSTHDYEKFIAKLESWKQALKINAEDHISKGYDFIYKDLKKKYRAMMLTPYNIVALIIGSILVLSGLFVTAFIFWYEFKTGRHDANAFLIPSYILLAGFGMFLQVWYSVYF